MLKELNFDNFNEEIKNGVKLIEFYTVWCGYCKKQLLELEAMNKIWVGQIDADKNPELATKYNISAYPTFMIFKNGAEADRFSGFKKKEELTYKILEHLK